MKTIKRGTIVFSRRKNLKKQSSIKKKKDTDNLQHNP